MESRRENSGGGKRKRIGKSVPEKSNEKKNWKTRENPVSNERPASFRNDEKKPAFGERPAGKRSPRSYNDTSRSAARTDDTKRPYKRRDDSDSDKPVRRTSTRDTSDSPRPYKRRDDSDSDRPVRRTSTRDTSDSPRPYKRRDDSDSDKPVRRTSTRDTSDSPRPYKRRDDSDTDKPVRRSSSRDDSASPRPYKKRDSSSSDRPARKSYDADSPRPYRSETDSDKPERRKSYDSDSPRPAGRRPSSSEERPKRRDNDGDDRPKTWKKPSEFFGKPKDGTETYKRRSADSSEEKASGKSSKPASKTDRDSDGTIRLNKYIANAGICSRREADELIAAGSVKVNGEIITEMGHKVGLDDKVVFGDQSLKSEAKRYVLLNKPKDYITTVEDPDGRKTVMGLVKSACNERIYPVGRLDRNTSGVLLFTNDGEMTKKLTHPSHRIRKVYHVVLDQNLSPEHFKDVENGLELEDGFIKVDAIDFVGTGGSKKELGIEIHSGKNRIVRRIFEQLGYTITRLDRVVFAGLTKKDLQRGHWRHLTREEINFLKML